MRESVLAASPRNRSTQSREPSGGGGGGGGSSNIPAAAASTMASARLHAPKTVQSPPLDDDDALMVIADMDGETRHLRRRRASDSDAMVAPFSALRLTTSTGGAGPPCR